MNRSSFFGMLTAVSLTPTFLLPTIIKPQKPIVLGLELFAVDNEHILLPVRKFADLENSGSYIYRAIYIANSRQTIKHSRLRYDNDNLLVVQDLHPLVTLQPGDSLQFTYSFII